MISATLFLKNQQIVGFECRGHADYDEEGADIVCSAVSALTFNAVNSIEELTGDGYTAEEAPDGGFLKFQFKHDTISGEALLLMDSLSLGLKMIEETYGSAYLTVREEHISP